MTTRLFAKVACAAPLALFAILGMSALAQADDLQHRRCERACEKVYRQCADAAKGKYFAGRKPGGDASYDMGRLNVDLSTCYAQRDRCYAGC